MKRFLHIGVFRGGALVDDRFVPEKGTVTVGRTADNTVALLGSNLPEQYKLFTFDRHVPVLHVAAGVTGELALDGKTKQPLDALKSRGKAEGAGWTLELPEPTRGWVAMGDTTFFVQIAGKPPPPPPSSLPRVARGGFFSRIEPVFASVFAIAFVIESSFLVAIAQMPHIEPDAPAQEVDRFAEMKLEKKVEEKKDDEDAKKKAEEEAKKRAEEEARKKKKEPETKAQHEEAVKKAVQANKLLVALGAAGGHGALENVFAAGNAFNANIADAFAGAGGVKLANGDDAPGHKGADGDGQAVGIGDLGAAAGGSGRGGLGEKRHIAPQISIEKDDIDVDSKSVDKDALGRYIHARLSAIQRCYEQQLKLNPSLRGKIVIRFTVTPAGRVGECAPDSDSMGNEEVTGCIVRTIRSWIFPFKPEDEVPVTFPFVFQPGG